MNNSYKILTGVVAALILVWIGFSIGSDNQDETDLNKKTIQEKTVENIKIGVLSPLSGDAAIYGEAHQKTTDLAVAEINAKGGINGSKIELIYEDGACNGKDATSAMQKFVNIDKVEFVIGGICSSETLAAVPIATQNQVMLFSPGSSSPDLTGISNYFVRNFPSDATQGEVLANYAYSKQNIKSIAILQEQQDYTLGIYKAFEKKFTELGGTIYYEKFVTGEKGFRTVLTKLKANNPDALFIIANTGGNAEPIMQELTILKWDTRLLINDNVAGEVEVIKRNAEILEGAITAIVGVDLNNHKFVEFKNNYKTKYGNDLAFESFDPIFYDAVYMLSDALNKGGQNPEEAIAWMKNIENWLGASGITNIKDDGDRVSGHVLKVVKNGKVVPID